MRTTVRLDQELLAQAKALAARTHRTLNELIEQALRARIEVERSAQRPAGSIPTFSGRGPRPGIDINDTSTLLDQMEGPVDPD
jgi:hypothetical protein